MSLDPTAGQPAQNRVTPQPTPVTVDLGEADTAEGDKLVVLRVGMLTGETVVFLDPTSAVGIGEALAEHAKSVAGKPSVARHIPKGLIVPGQDPRLS
jgi:hypothetical protein